MTVHIVCATFNGARFLGDLLDSIARQTIADWRLWIRDDGSTDDTLRIARTFATRDKRVHVTSDNLGRLGATASFGRLLETLPPDVSYVAFADQDDVWLPEKLERLLSAVQRAEREKGVTTPVLVHSDLTVVDEALTVVAPSFRRFAGIPAEPTTLNRFVVRNPVTGAATLFNGALLRVASPIPASAIFHDWWLALVAVTFGRVVAIEETTVLYRQHASNVVGARAGDTSPANVATLVHEGLGNAARFRRDVERTAEQAAAFLSRYGSRLSGEQTSFLRSYVRMPTQPFLRRKLSLARMRVLPEHGLLRTLGILIRG